MPIDKTQLLILAVELILCILIIAYVPYTEIDWKAYMQEVAGFESGELNYLNLKGDTGYLPYPAGFLYIFYGLKKLTSDGKNIFAAQCIFAGIYLLVQFIVLRIYSVGQRMPPWTWALLLLSKRVHSIFMLRCFNDCIAILFGYLAILHFAKHKWYIACVFYSLAVSIKMNMLLYAPGILLVLLLGTSGVQQTAICLSICAGIQLLLGLPFLTTYPIEYLSRAFDLNRTFEYQWTVNFRFLPEDIFVSKRLSLFLLFLTALAYTAFAYKWIQETWKAVQAKRSKATKLLGMDSPSFLVGIGNLSPHYIITTIFASNFVGIAFARTLHYQFYCWYWHMLPYLLWHAYLPNVIRLLLLVIIEVAFNVFPSTVWTSALLQIAHLILLVALYLTPVPFALFEINPNRPQIAKKAKSQ